MTQTGPKLLTVISLLSLGLVGACGPPTGSPAGAASTAVSTSVPADPPTTDPPTTDATTAATVTATPPDTPSDTASTPSTPSHTTAAGPVSCDARTLTARIASTSAAAGHARLVIAVRNTGPECSVTGYPDVTLLAGPGGTALPTRTTTDGDVSFPSVKPREVVLRSGGEASFDLGYSRVPSGDTSCVSAAAVRIALPRVTNPVEVKADVDACGGGHVAVSPVVAGTDGVGSAAASG
jgi:hypothetical protein